jgi:hypothetical protein
MLCIPSAHINSPVTARGQAFPEAAGLPSFRVDHINVHTPGAFGGSVDDSAEHGTDGGRLHGSNGLLAGGDTRGGSLGPATYFKEEGGAFHNGLRGPRAMQPLFPPPRPPACSCMVRVESLESRTWNVHGGSE